jgi:hypothetical protein
MSKPIIRLHDTDTNEIIDREMTDAEFAKYQEDQEIYQTQKAEAEAKAAQKAVLLERLGISEDEARLLLS